jgi:hypothetical protein
VAADGAAITAEIERPALKAASQYRLPVYLTCTLLALLSNFLAGKEVAWDLLNYHYYAGFSALHDRFAQDYFAAGIQSYLNPYAYVPFYALVSAGLPALLVSSILAIGHSVIFWLTFELALLVWPSSDERTRLAVALAAVALAFLNPTVIQQIGTSFADITTATLVVAGWLLLARALHVPSHRRVVLGAVLLGAAAALKATNAVYAVAAGAMLLMLPTGLPARVRYGVTYASTLLLSFVVVSAPWSYRLERSLGNPVLPLLNNLFRSPHYTTEPLRHLRFAPTSFAEALWRPFAMLAPRAMVHEELSAPDLRYALLVVLCVALAVRWYGSRRVSGAPASRSDAAHAPTRALGGLGLGLAVSWVLWLLASGNSRYFMPMTCIAAVVAMALLFRLLASHVKIRNYVLGAVLLLQSFQIVAGTEYRWNDAAWGGPWFRVEVPRQLAAEPSLYLSVGVQSNSFLAPFLDSGAGFVNIVGVYALAPDGVQGARLAALIDRYSPHLRVLARAPQDPDDLTGPSLATLDGVLGPFGLRIDPLECATITAYGLPRAVEIRLGPPSPADHAKAATAQFTSCRLVRSTADRSNYMARAQSVDLILDRVEDACPMLFQPRRMRTVRWGDAWVRTYQGTDLVAWVNRGRVKAVDLMKGTGDVLQLGSESDWLRAPQRLACGRRDGRVIANMLPPATQ